MTAIKNQKMRCVCFEDASLTRRCTQPVAARHRRAGYYFCIDHGHGLAFLMVDAFSEKQRKFALDLHAERLR